MAPERDRTPLPMTEEHTLLSERSGVSEPFTLNPRELRPALLVQRGPRIGDWYQFPAGKESFTVGRDHDVEFRIVDASVSRRHARFLIERVDGAAPRLWLEDLGSTNGSRVGRRRISERTLLHEGDLVCLGDIVLRYRLMDSEDRAFQEDIAQQVKNARKDPLTRLFSRRYLDDQLPGLVKSHRRNGQQISLLIADIDHFKSVNDVHGHMVGDEVLWRVAEAIRSSVRTADSPVRYGGEEFCVILPGTPLREALHVAERVRGSVEALDLTVVRPGLRAAVSIGVAELTDDEEQQDWMQRADIGLYEAKRNGRNRVCAGPNIITGLRTPQRDYGPTLPPLPGASDD
jgi:two-component system, cell cycle response regulator